MHQIHYLLLNSKQIIVADWVNPQKFNTKEEAMKFAQNTSKSFNGSCYNIYYRIIIDDAIQQYQKQEKDKYATDILAAIDAARDAGYDVYINYMPYENADDIELYEHDDDDDENEDEDN